jgi:hypothetical protein
VSAALRRVRTGSLVVVALLTAGAFGANAAVGCGGGDEGVAGTPAGEPTPELPPRGPAIEGLSPGTWSWVPFPESRCDDGSETGLGVNPGPETDLVVYFDGGGACWSFETCVTLGTSRHGPWGEAQLAGRVPGFRGTALDRDDAANPFRRWDLVFVPYCTGDVHSGDRATTYSGAGGEARTLEHRGRRNALAFARRIAATFPDARRVVIAGSSGGGYGALVNYDTLRRYWPEARGYLVDDTGPALRLLPSDAQRAAWWAAWGTPEVLDTFCPECTGNPAESWRALSRRWPQDRVAFLTSLQDATMRRYLLADPETFERAVLDTVHGAIEPLPNVHAFVIEGDAHTLLAAPGAFAADGTPLLEWLRAMVEDDPGWGPRGP